MRPNVSGCFASCVHPTSDLFVPEVKNRVTGRSMGEHTEDMAKTWNIGRQEQDELALQGLEGQSRRRIAAFLRI